MEKTLERPTIGVNPAALVKLPLFELITGYTVKAVERKIEDGKWLEGREYVRAPDGNILIILEGFYKWAKGQRQRG